MTHEQFIKPETAKLAKQAGFDWRTYPHYQDFYGDKLLEAGLSGNWNRHNDCYSAPTQSALQRWLREVKSIQVWSEFHNQIAKIKSGWIVCFGFFPDNFVEVDYLSGYRTYEAALEAGLQKCLTLLIEKL